MPTPPPRRPPPRPPARAPAGSRAAAPRPLSAPELDELQALLDRVPAPLEALDVSMLDGFLCGVLVQPQPVPASRWLSHVTDADGRPLPPGVLDTGRLQALVQRRHAELNDAINRRQWFDPWVFELHADDAGPQEADDDDDGEFDAAAPSEAVYPWVAGFALAVEIFPALMRADAAALNGPLALLYRHLGADDLEDADDLLAEIETLEPPADLGEAVEELVRATLLLADVGRPLAVPPRAGGARRQGPRRR